jgi:hypothetical protein
VSSSSISVGANRPQQQPQQQQQQQQHLQFRGATGLYAAPTAGTGPAPYAQAGRSRSEVNQYAPRRFYQ